MRRTCDRCWLARRLWVYPETNTRDPRRPSIVRQASPARESRPPLNSETETGGSRGTSKRNALDSAGGTGNFSFVKMK